MDTLTQYRQFIHAILQEYGSSRPAYGDVEAVQLTPLLCVRVWPHVSAADVVKPCKGVTQLQRARTATPVVTPTGAQRRGGVFPRIRTKDSSRSSPSSEAKGSA